MPEHDDPQGNQIARSWFHTGEPERAEPFIRDTYATHGLQLERPRDGFGYAHRAASTGQFAVQQVRHYGSLRTEITALEDLLVISTVRRGHLQVDRSCFDDVDAGPGDTVLIPPHGRFRASMHDAELDTVTLSRTALADYAAATWGIDPDRLQMLSTRPLTPAATEHWDLTVEHIRNTLLTNPAAVESPLLLHSAQRLLATAFLATFPTITLTGATRHAG